jgi:hypothetical protein
MKGGEPVDRQEHLTRLSEALAQAASQAEEARSVVGAEDQVAANTIEEIFQELLALMAKTASLFEGEG